MSRNSTASLAAVLLLLPLLLLWPLPLIFSDALLASPGFEAATHTWGLWAALQAGQPLVVETQLLAWPQGTRFVLVDPLHLPLFALGHALGGAAGGFNLVAWGGLVVAGLAGALLARELDAPPVVGAILAMATPPLLCAATDGITEDLAVGWVGLQLALLLRFLRTGRPLTGLGAALALGACAWGGPYNGLWAALVDTVVLIGTLRRPRRALAAGAVLAGGGLLSLPVLRAVLTSREAGLPGAADRAGMPALEHAPERFRGGLMTGSDLLDAWLPAPLTGGVPPEASHTAYLGAVVLVVAGVAAWREPRCRRWLLGAFCLALIALGPHLYLAGEPLMLGDRALLGPVGMLLLALPAAGRITRWYRAAAVAGLLLAPVAARAVKGRPRRAMVLVAAVLFDGLLLAPLPWPRPASPLPAPQAWAALDDLPEGAVLELPLTTSGSPPPGQWRDVGALAQVQHARPSGSGAMGLPPSEEARRGQRAILGLMRNASISVQERQALDRAGFVAVALHTTFLPVSEAGAQALVACFGPPLSVAPGLRLHALPALSESTSSGTSSGCLTSMGTPPDEIPR